MPILAAGRIIPTGCAAVFCALLALAGCSATPAPDVTESPVRTETAAATADDITRRITLYWERDATMQQSSIAYLGQTPSGERYRAAIGQADTACDVRYSLRWHKVGSWALVCDSGRMASGTFRSLGKGKGSFGWGEDERGHPVRYVVHDRDGAIRDELQDWLVGAPPVLH